MTLTIKYVDIPAFYGSRTGTFTEQLEPGDSITDVIQTKNYDFLYDDFPAGNEYGITVSVTSYPALMPDEDLTITYTCTYDNIFTLTRVYNINGSNFKTLTSQHHFFEELATPYKPFMGFDTETHQVVLYPITQDPTVATSEEVDFTTQFIPGQYRDTSDDVWPSGWTAPDEGTTFYMPGNNVTYTMNFSGTTIECTFNFYNTSGEIVYTRTANISGGSLLGSFTFSQILPPEPYDTYELVRNDISSERVTNSNKVFNYGTFANLRQINYITNGDMTNPCAQPVKVAVGTPIPNNPKWPNPQNSTYIRGMVFAGALDITPAWIYPDNLDVSSAMPDHDIYVSAKYCPKYNIAYHPTSSDANFPVIPDYNASSYPNQVISYQVYSPEVPGYEFDHIDSSTKPADDIMPEEDITINLVYVKAQATLRFILEDERGFSDETIETRTGLDYDSPIGTFPTLPDLGTDWQYTDWRNSLYTNELVTADTLIGKGMTVYTKAQAKVTVNYYVNGIIYQTKIFWLSPDRSGDGKVPVNLKQISGEFGYAVTSITGADDVEFHEIEDDYIINLTRPATININASTQTHILTVVDNATGEVKERLDLVTGSNIIDFVNITGYKSATVTPGYLKYMPDNDYTVRIDYHNFDARRLTWHILDDSVTEYYIPGREIVMQPDPRIDGKTFRGWIGLPLNNIMPDNEVDVYAQLVDVTKPEFTLTYKVDGTVWKTEKYRAGDTVSMEPAPAKTGYNFITWNPSISTMPEFDLTVEAVYEDKPAVYHTVTFIIEDKTIDIRTLEVGSKINLPEIAQRPGYVLEWTGYRTYMPDFDFTVTGQYTPDTETRYAARFYADGELVSAHYYLFGDTITAPAAPEVPGYTFVEWQNCPQTMPAADLDIYALLTPEQYHTDSVFSVIYKIDSRIYRSVLYKAGSSVTLVDAPARAGYEFSGWGHETTFTMPENDVIVSGYYVRNYTNGQHVVDYYTPAAPVRSKKKAALRATANYDLHDTQEYYTGQTIIAPSAPEVSGKTFIGWNGLPTRMGQSDVDVYAVYSIALPENLVEVTESTIPVFREKLVNDESGNVRKGNRLDTVLGDTETVTINDEAVKIRRVSVVSGNQTVQTNYFVRADAASDETVTETAVIKIGDEYYDAEVTEGRVNIIDKSESQAVPESTYYILTDRVTYEDGRYYEMLYSSDAPDTYFRGSELYIYGQNRPVYGKFEDGHPSLVEDSEGKFTNWVQDLKLKNNHNDVTYSLVLSRDRLAKITVITNTDGVEKETILSESDTLYRYLWYPVIDIALLPKSQIERVAQENATGSMLAGDRLYIFHVTTASTTDACVCYVMKDGERVGLVTGSLGDAIELPETISLKGWKFVKYIEPIPASFTAKTMTVSAEFVKDEESEDPDSQQDKTKKYSLTHKIANYNWRHTIKLAAGETIPAHPTPDIDGITVTDWVLASAYFEGNKMPEFDVTYNAVYTTDGGSGSGEDNRHLLTWKVQYTTTSLTVTETVASYYQQAGTVITPPSAPYKNGGTFAGWGEYPSYMPDEDLTVTGTYTGTVIDKYNLRYYVGGILYKTVQYERGAAITPEPDPVEEGKTFSGWIGLPNVMPGHDVDVNGLMYGSGEVSDLVNIKYMLDGKEYKSYRMKKGASLPEEPAPVKAGYTFSGWTPKLSTVPVYDTVISGQMIANEGGQTDTYLLRFYLNSSLYSQQKLKAGAAIVQPNVNIAGFSGWKDCPATMPAKDLDIYGTVTSDQTYKLSYYVDMVLYKQYDLNPGDLITAEPAPSNAPEGKVWSGWQNLPNDMRMPASNLRIDGEWQTPGSTGEYRLYYYDRGRCLYTQDYNAGDTIVLPATPVRQGYTFVEWQGMPADMKMPASPLSVQAVWKDADGSVIATYHLITVELSGFEGDRVYGQQKCTPGATMTYLDAPASRTGYTFQGWNSVDVDALGGVVPDRDFTVNGRLVADEKEPKKEVLITWNIIHKGQGYTIKEETKTEDQPLYAPGDPMKLLRAAGADTTDYEFDHWDSFPQYVPDTNATYTGYTRVLQGQSFTVYIKYLYIEANGTERTVDVSSSQQFGGQDFRMPEDPADQPPYFFAGWNGIPKAPYGKMPFSDITLTGVFIHQDADAGNISGYCQVRWMLPTYTLNQLDHHPYTVWRRRYYTIGTIFTNPAASEVPDVTGLDGFSYEFVSWSTDGFELTQSNAPYYEVYARMRRKGQSYNVNYYLTWYHSASNIENNKLWKTEQVAAGDTIPLPDPEAEGYMFGGTWTYDTLPVSEIMPWRDVSMYGDMYSFDYAGTQHHIEGWHQISWNSYWFDGSDSYRFNSKYTIKKEWVKDGATIVEPEGPFYQPYFPERWQFTGWDEHPATMPANHIEILATWEKITEYCNITWTLNVYAEDGTVTTEIFKQNDKQAMGSVLQLPAPQPERQNYIFVGWNITKISNLAVLVPRETEWTVSGDLVHEGCESYGQMFNYCRIRWRIGTHTPNQLDHDPYQVWKSKYVPYGAEFEDPEETPEPWQGQDGFMYEFVSWKTHTNVAPRTSVFNIDSNDQRASVEYDCEYYIRYIDLGGEETRLYTTVKTPAGTTVQDITPELEDGWYWNGIWIPDTLPYNYTMPWRNYKLTSKAYTQAYIDYHHPQDIEAYSLRFASHNFNFGHWGVDIDTVFSSEIKKAGDPIVEPIGIEITPPAITGDRFVFDHWESHPTTMPASHLTIFAVFRERIEECKITFKLHVYDKNGNVTDETYWTNTQKVGSAFEWPSTPARTDYYFDGWNVIAVTGSEIVPKAEELEVWGELYHVEYDRGSVAGMTRVAWMLHTHTTNQLDHHPYSTWYVRYVKQGDYIADPANKPENWTGLDGYEYEFVSWKPHATTSTASTLEVIAEDRRAKQEYKCTYRIKFYRSPSGERKEIDFCWVIAEPGTYMQVEPVIPSGWIADSVTASGWTRHNDSPGYLVNGNMPWNDVILYKYYHCYDDSVKDFTDLCGTLNPWPSNNHSIPSSVPGPDEPIVYDGKVYVSYYIEYYDGTMISDTQLASIVDCAPAPNRKRWEINTRLTPCDTNTSEFQQAMAAAGIAADTPILRWKAYRYVPGQTSPYETFYDINQDGGVKAKQFGDEDCTYWIFPVFDGSIEKCKVNFYDNNVLIKTDYVKPGDYIVYPVVDSSRYILLSQWNPMKSVAPYAEEYNTYRTTTPNSGTISSESDLQNYQPIAGYHRVVFCRKHADDRVIIGNSIQIYDNWYDYYPVLKYVRDGATAEVYSSWLYGQKTYKYGAAGTDEKYWNSYTFSTDRPGWTLKRLYNSAIGNVLGSQTVTIPATAPELIVFEAEYEENAKYTITTKRSLNDATPVVDKIYDNRIAGTIVDIKAENFSYKDGWTKTAVKYANGKTFSELFLMPSNNVEIIAYYTGSDVVKAYFRIQYRNVTQWFDSLSSADKQNWKSLVQGHYGTVQYDDRFSVDNTATINESLFLQHAERVDLTELHDYYLVMPSQTAIDNALQNPPQEATATLFIVYETGVKFEVKWILRDYTKAIFQNNDIDLMLDNRNPAAYTGPDLVAKYGDNYDEILLAKEVSQRDENGDMCVNVRFGTQPFTADEEYSKTLARWKQNTSLQTGSQLTLPEYPPSGATRKWTSAETYYGVVALSPSGYTRLYAGTHAVMYCAYLCTKTGKLIDYDYTVLGSKRITDGTSLTVSVIGGPASSKTVKRDGVTYKNAGGTVKWCVANVPEQFKSRYYISDGLPSTMPAYNIIVFYKFQQ